MPAQRPVLPDLGVLFGILLVPSTTEAAPFVGVRVMVTVVGLENALKPICKLRRPSSLTTWPPAVDTTPLPTMMIWPRPASPEPVLEVAATDWVLLAEADDVALALDGPPELAP